MLRSLVHRTRTLSSLPSLSLRPALLSSTLPPFRAHSTTPDDPLNTPTLLTDPSAGFAFARHNPLPPKPRSRGVTEIRGPYYSAFGPRAFADLLDTMALHIDGLKFAGGSFALLPEPQLRRLIDMAHERGVYVSTGGWVEHLLASGGREAVERYLERCKGLGFDVVEVSSGFLSLPDEDWMRVCERVAEHGMKPKPEIGIQFGAGGDTEAGELEAIGTGDPGKLINLAKRFIDNGVERIMIESEGITENVTSWRTEVVSEIMKELPSEKVMFEAADPAVFNWYIREFGIDVNLFVDHSQVVQLAGLRRGIWGKSDTFGKVVSFRDGV